MLDVRAGSRGVGAHPPHRNGGGMTGGSKRGILPRLDPDSRPAPAQIHAQTLAPTPERAGIRGPASDGGWAVAGRRPRPPLAAQAHPAR